MTTLEYKSLPSRERELKQDVGDAVVDVLLSLPSQEFKQKRSSPRGLVAPLVSVPLLRHDTQNLSLPQQEYHQVIRLERASLKLSPLCWYSYSSKVRGFMLADSSS